MFQPCVVKHDIVPECVFKRYFDTENKNQKTRHLKMSTPAMALNSAIRNIVLCMWWMWVTTFVVSRIYLLHEAYIEEANKRSDERWLLKQCSNPEFYSNIRQHTDICTEVATNSKSSLLLKAVYKVASSTHICGKASCMDTAYSFVIRFGWQATMLAVIIMMMAPNFVFALLHHLQQQRFMHEKEEAVLKSCFAETPHYQSKESWMDLQKGLLLRQRKNHNQHSISSSSIQIL